MTARILAATLVFAVIWCGWLLFSGMLNHQQTVGTHTYQGRVYDGSTLIGVCGGQPPVVMPQSSDPSVDVTWYPECPR